MWYGVGIATGELCTASICSLVNRLALAESTSRVYGSTSFRELAFAPEQRVSSNGKRSLGNGQTNRRETEERRRDAKLAPAVRVLAYRADNNVEPYSPQIMTGIGAKSPKHSPPATCL